MNKPSAEFSTRYDAARAWRLIEQPYIEEVLSFICPGRENDFNRQETTPQDIDRETFMSLPEDLALDFASDMVTYFTPSETRWTEYMVMVEVEKQQAKKVAELVDAREDAIFKMIQSSNYNDMASQIMFEASHGTVAMWVDQGHLTHPIFVETVPPNELLIVPGYMGILDRFREKWEMASSLPSLFQGSEYSLEEPALKKMIATPGAKVKVCWGFWLDWKDAGNPMWKSQVTVNGKVISGAEPLTLGPLAGSCPLLVGRFNPQPGRPWGRGPARKALPDIRVLDALDEGVLDGLDQALRNTIIYPNDGVLDLQDGGLEAGRAYPATRGFDRNSVFELSRNVNLDTGFFSQERLEERMMAAFYQDGPRQRGDTPPTATQVLDERRRVQIRIGKPSAPLFTEFFMPFIQRVEHLGVESKRLDGPLTHDGEVIKVLPISPLQKAQNLDKVMTARSNLELGQAAFAEAFGQVVDVPTTFQNIVTASGDELTIIKEAQDEPAPPPE